MTKMETLKVTAAGDREIVMTREFDAPRSLVFDAMTRPELLKRWYFGPAGWTLSVCEIDLKVGGTYRYVWSRPGRPDMGMSGVYRDIVQPDRIVQTESFDESWYPGEALATFVLMEQDGKTTLKLTVLYESLEARDGVHRSEANKGLAEAYDRLEELLASPALKNGFEKRR